MQEYVTAAYALQKLKDGNLIYLNSKTSSGDISPQKRLYTSENGQSPYAIIVSCSDSRVIPECIFNASIGELFVVRVAGNVIDNFQLGSIEYGIENLGCKIVVVMGHTQCGAVNAAIRKNNKGLVSFITDEIWRAIGEEVDPIKANLLNIKRGVEKLKDAFNKTDGVEVVGALYHTDSGIVDFDMK